MTAAKKKSKRSKARAPEESGTSSYFFEDVLALAETLARHRKDWGAQKLSEFAGSARDFATSAEAIPKLGNFVNPLATSLGEFADYVNGTEFDQIIADAATFARRHPVYTIGGGILVGLVATQVFRSTKTAHKTAGAKSPKKQSSTGKKLRKTVATKSQKSNGHAHSIM